MSSQKTIFQTLENRENPDHVEEFGPFLCNNKNAWLGKGYYFWDTFVENAHWWGKNNGSNNDYFICETHIDYNKELCLDLHGDTEKLLELGDIINEFKRQNLLRSNSTVVEIIRFLQKQNLFKYPSIRVSSQKFNNDRFQVKFDKKNPSKFELKPLIQICVYDLKKVNLDSFKIVYPEEYSIQL